MSAQSSASGVRRARRPGSQGAGTRSTSGSSKPRWRPRNDAGNSTMAEGLRRHSMKEYRRSKPYLPYYCSVAASQDNIGNARHQMANAGPSRTP